MWSIPQAQAMPSTQVLSTRCWTMRTLSTVCAAHVSAEASQPVWPERCRDCRCVRRLATSMNRPTRRKIAFIGGGGVRTPLIVFGVNEAAATLGAEELVLFDPDRDRVRIMAEL